MKCLNAKQMRDIDQQVINEKKIPSLVLMEQVAMNLYHEVIALIDQSQSIQVICGNGNNGGDGFALARLLYLNHYHVSVGFVGQEEAMTHDCFLNSQIAKAYGVPQCQDIGNCDVLIDAILGTGCSRPLEGKLANVIETINQSKALVIALDVPSGVSSDTAAIMGCCVHADITLTIATVKCGCVIHPGKEQCGMIKVVEVSSLKPLIDQFPTFYHFIDHKSMKKMVPKRISHSHKGTYGKVLCVGGSQTMSGSITLASLAAYRSGCGIVTSAIPSCIQATVASSLHEMMTLPLDEVNGEMAESCCKQLAQVMNQYSCILYGCGCGRASQQVTILQTLLHSHVPLIIDADGLTALKPLLSTLDPHRKLILTPHLAEFARLFDFSLEDVIEHRYACLQKVQQRYPQLIVVLKSETTMIHSQSCCWINNYGNSGLAVGGSGDTLAGMIAGWLAQSQCELESCVLGVYLHACCADEVVKKMSEYALMPSDLIEVLPQMIQSLLS